MNPFTIKVLILFDPVWSLTEDKSDVNVLSRTVLLSAVWCEVEASSESEKLQQWNIKVTLGLAEVGLCLRRQRYCTACGGAGSPAALILDEEYGRLRGALQETTVSFLFVHKGRDETFRSSGGGWRITSIKVSSLLLTEAALFVTVGEYYVFF